MLKPKTIPTCSNTFKSIQTPRKRLLCEAKEFFETKYLYDLDYALVNGKYVHALLSMDYMLVAKLKLIGEFIVLPINYVKYALDNDKVLLLYIQVNRRFYYFDPINIEFSGREISINKNTFWKFKLGDAFRVSTREKEAEPL